MRKNFVSFEPDNSKLAQRKIHSFVRRKGRLTRSQQHALNMLWSGVGIDYQAEPLNFDALFERVAPVTLEVGFGMGSSLIGMAKSYPEINFLGIEVHLPGVGACLSNVHKAGLKNLRIICHDAVEVLETMIPDAALTLIQIFFPDPWHKMRHNKRRIIQAPFVDLAAKKLSLGGILHIVTDWKPYAEHILNIMSEAKIFSNLSPTKNYVLKPTSRPITKFEHRAKRLGHDVYDIMFKKTQTQ